MEIINFNLIFFCYSINIVTDLFEDKVMLKKVTYLVFIVFVLLFISACNSGSSASSSATGDTNSTNLGGNGNSTTFGSKWNQMNWNQGKWQ